MCGSVPFFYFLFVSLQPVTYSIRPGSDPPAHRVQGYFFKTHTLQITCKALVLAWNHRLFAFHLCRGAVFQSLHGDFEGVCVCMVRVGHLPWIVVPFIYRFLLGGDTFFKYLCGYYSSVL